MFELQTLKQILSCFLSKKKKLFPHELANSSDISRTIRSASSLDFVSCLISCLFFCLFIGALMQKYGKQWHNQSDFFEKVIHCGRQSEFDDTMYQIHICIFSRSADDVQHCHKLWARIFSLRTKIDRISQDQCKRRSDILVRVWTV